MERTNGWNKTELKWISTYAWVVFVDQLTRTKGEKQKLVLEITFQMN